MRSYPAHFAHSNEGFIVCLIQEGVVEAVNRAYEEDGEVELYDPDSPPAIEMPEWNYPEQLVLLGEGGQTSHGAGTGQPWEAFCWYAKPEPQQVVMAHCGPSTGCYAVCRVQLRVAEGKDETPRTFWGYMNGR